MCSEAVWFVENISCQFEYGQVDNNTSIIKTGTLVSFSMLHKLVMKMITAGKRGDEGDGGEESDEEEPKLSSFMRCILR